MKEFREYITELNIKYKLSALLGLLMLVSSYNSTSLMWAMTGPVLGLVAGYLISLTYSEVERRGLRYAGYFILIGVLVVSLLAVHAQGVCQAYIPYMAENIFTGQEKEFVYGGCESRPHPWFYEMTSS